MKGKIAFAVLAAIALIGFANAEQCFAKKDLVASYAFNQNLADETSFNNHLQSQGVVDYLRKSECVVGKCVSLSTQNPIARGAFQLTSPKLSFAAWVNWIDNGNAQVIVSKGDLGYGNTLGVFNAVLGSDGSAQVLIDTSDGEYYITAEDYLPQGQWSHLTGTYDGQELRIYVNGVLSGVQQATGFFPQNDYPLIVGNQLEAGELSTQHFNGALDELHVWNAAITSEQVRKLYETEFSGRHFHSAC